MTGDGCSSDDARRTGHRRWTVAGALILAVVAGIPTVAIEAQTASSPALAIGTIDSIWSSALGERRTYFIYTPPSYAEPTRVPRDYPVLYLLDGDSHFHGVTGILHTLASGITGAYVVPEMIVVAITNVDRRRDFTPTRATRDPYGRPLPPDWTNTGGNPAFLRFLSSELIPRIDSSYRTAPFRMLVGHSMAGLAVVNTLFTAPETFHAYVAIDPMMWYDDRLMLRMAPDVFRRPAPPARTLFLAQANNITPFDTGTVLNYNDILQFNALVQTENSSGIRYGYKYYDRDDHFSIPLPAEYDALRFIFEGYRADIPRASVEPGYLTEHVERASSRLGYRAIPSAQLANFVVQIGAMSARDTSRRVPPLARVMGTWMRDSASGPNGAEPVDSDAVVISSLGAGARMTERRSGPAGAVRSTRECPRVTTTRASEPPDGEGCQLQLVADGAAYTISARRAGRLVVIERGKWAASDDGRVLRHHFTEYPERGAPVERRRVYARLY